jgi:hypothetical protein
MTNWRLADKIGAEFGCESPLYIDNILSTSSEESLGAIVNDVWAASGYTMTKENWAHRKLWYLKTRFHVVCFARRTEDSLPPTRSRVVCWMHALSRTLGVAGSGFVADAVSGYSAWVSELVRTADDLELPLVWWHDVMSMDKAALVAMLGALRMPGVDVDKCADNIISTRMTFEQSAERRAPKDADLWRKELWESEGQHQSQPY